MKKLIYLLPLILFACEKYDEIEVKRTTDTLYITSKTDTVKVIISKTDTVKIIKKDTVVIKYVPKVTPPVKASLKDSILGVYIYQRNDYTYTFNPASISVISAGASEPTIYTYTLTGTLDNFTLSFLSLTYKNCYFTKQGSIISDGKLIFVRV